jgi:hypothetical protein
MAHAEHVTPSKLFICPIIFFASLSIGARDCLWTTGYTAPDTNYPSCGDVYTSGAGGDVSGMGAYGSTADTGSSGAGGGSFSDPGDPGDPSPEGLMCEDGAELSEYVRCWGLGSTACAAQCSAIGAHCVEHAVHPENPSVGIGDLKQCMSNTLASTCTYCFTNGDVCTFICAFMGCGVPGCINTGGKGCE